MDKKLKYIDNKNIICSQCDKPRYMGYTTKPDSQLCCCLWQDKIPVYDNRKPLKTLEPFDKFIEYL